MWYAALDIPESLIPSLAQTLHPDEEARAARFFFQRDQRRFTVARGVLRSILARYLQCSPADISFGYTAHGKPVLDMPAPASDLYFNLSHSQDIALYACAWQRQVGVDVEYIRVVERAEQIARRFFTPQEQQVWLSLPPEQRQVAFFNCWTRKEACLKARGFGLAHSLDTVEVSLAPGEPAALLHIAGEPVEQWGIQAVVPAAGYAGAVVAAGQHWQLRCFRWTPADTSDTSEE